MKKRPSMSRLPIALAPVLLGALLLGVACAPTQKPAEPAPLSRLGAQQGVPGKLTPAIVSSELAVGPNQRFLMIFIGPDNSLVANAEVEMAFFKVVGPSEAQLRSRASAQFREPPGLSGKGVYVARTDFDEPGDWGVVAVVNRPGEQPAELRAAFQVKEQSATPAIGGSVPASRTLTGRTREEIERFSSARPPDPAFYRLSIADALREGKPLAVLFATPGFCTSRICGPSMEVLTSLREQYGDRANFIHVEIYKDGRPQEVVPFVSEWGLPSEPWLFIVGADGRLVDKFEGTVTVEDAAPALERALEP